MRCWVSQDGWKMNLQYLVLHISESFYRCSKTNITIYESDVSSSFRLCKLLILVKKWCSYLLYCHRIVEYYRYSRVQYSTGQYYSTAKRAVLHYSYILVKYVRDVIQVRMWHYGIVALLLQAIFRLILLAQTVFIFRWCCWVRWDCLYCCWPIFKFNVAFTKLSDWLLISPT